MFLSKQGLLCGLGLISLLQPTVSQEWDGPSPYADGFAPDVTLADGWNASYSSFEGNASSYPPLLGGTDSEAVSSLNTRAAKDFYLRIMPLGASIVEGVKSSDESGFRKLLRQQLRWKGWKVNMVGTKNNGKKFADNVRSELLNSRVKF
jgi:hypothetical protein